MESVYIGENDEVVVRMSDGGIMGVRHFMRQSVEISDLEELITRLANLAVQERKNARVLSREPILQIGGS